MSEHGARHRTKGARWLRLLGFLHHHRSRLRIYKVIAGACCVAVRCVMVDSFVACNSGRCCELHSTGKRVVRSNYLHPQSTKTYSTLRSKSEYSGNFFAENVNFIINKSSTQAEDQLTLTCVAIYSARVSAKHDEKEQDRPGKGGREPGQYLRDQGGALGKRFDSTRKPTLHRCESVNHYRSVSSFNASKQPSVIKRICCPIS